MKHTKGTTILVLLLQIGFSHNAATIYLSSHNDTAVHQPIVKPIPISNNLQLPNDDTILIDVLDMWEMKPTATIAAASSEKMHATYKAEQLRSLNDRNVFLKSVRTSIDNLEKEKINLVKDKVFKNSNVQKEQKSGDRITKDMFENEVKDIKEIWGGHGNMGAIKVMPLENTRAIPTNVYQPSVIETDTTYNGGNSNSMSAYDNTAITSNNAFKSANTVRTSDNVSKSAKSVRTSDNASTSAKSVRTSDNASKSAKSVRTSDNASTSTNAVRTSDDASKSANTVKTSDDESKTAKTIKAMDTSNQQMISKRTVDADSSCQLDVVETALTFSETIETAGGTVELVCRGDVMVNKCEGLCNSNVWPSVNHYDGYQKECSCCRDAGTRQRDITLASCTIGSAAVTGHFLTRTIVEPASCSCLQCRS